MTTLSLTRQTPPATSSVNIGHLYVTGDTRVIPGDVALCGHVKQTTNHWPGTDLCVVCADLADHLDGLL